MIVGDNKDSGKALAPSWCGESSRCLLRGLTVQRGPSEPSTKGTSDGPHPAYPLARPPGRGSDHALLPHRRRLCPAQSPRRSTLRVHKATLGFGSHRAYPLPAAAGCGKRTLFLARRPAVLRSLVPGGGGSPSFLVPSASEEAQALPGAPQAGRPF